MSDLASVIIGEPDDSARIPQLRQGVVTQVSPLLVRVGAATTATPCNALGSYAPVVGDVVSVLVLSGDRLVLGKAGPSATPGNLGRVVQGTVLANTLPTSQVLTQTAGNMTVPAGGRWLIVYTVKLASTAALNVVLRMYGVISPSYFDYEVQGPVAQSATFAYLADGGATVSLYGQNKGSQPVSVFADSSNHSLMAIGLI